MANKSIVYNNIRCQGCAIENTVRLISGKWKSVILYHLVQKEVCRFSYFTKVIKNCSKRMLALQLKELEDDGIIQKKIYPVIPPKTEYRLTKLGQSLVPIVLEMEKWGTGYTNHDGASKKPLADDKVVKS